MSAFLQGLLIGFSIAIPVGPIGLLCLRRTLNHGRVSGLVSGMGAATADAIYGIPVALGLSAVKDFLLRYQSPIELVGSLVLLYLGVTIFRARPPTAEARAASAPTLRVAYFSTLALTLANPTTILSFFGIFASVGLASAAAGPWSALTVVLGVFLGSAVWWVLLSLTAGAVGPRLQQGGLRTLNRISGLIILALALWQLLKALQSFT